MHPPAANKASPVLEGAAYKAVFSKIDWRLIPLLLIAYMVAYLDRINIGYAQLQMKQTFSISSLGTAIRNAPRALDLGSLFVCRLDSGSAGSVSTN